MHEPIAVYVHIPFCPSKCGYCDFNSYAMSGAIVERTVRAIESEIRRSSIAGRPAKTVFFGGGTPTFLEAHDLALLLDAVNNVHPISPETEVTSEANPGTVDQTKFAGMRAAGFNRISLGAQSFASGDLMRLGRVHEAGDVPRAVEAARKAGFDNINLDLMFALPSQTSRGWRSNLDLATSLRPQHLSLYCLTIEPNTRFYRLHNRGMLDLPDDDAQVAMYDEAIETCSGAGYQQYEISNFALPGKQCQHNLCYWRGEEYAGYGPGAVGRVGNRRSTNMKGPEAYCQAVESGADLACESETLDEETLRFERLMLGIRLAEGIPIGLASETGIAKTQQRGWVTREDGVIRLSPAGRHFCSDVAVELA